MREVAAAELRESGHARPDDEARGVVLDLAHGRREEDGPNRPRADEVHVAADDVQELRDLVELVAAEEAADRRVERIAGRHETRADPLLGVGEERAELEDREGRQRPPDARAAVEDLSPARRLDRDGDDDRERQERDEPEPGDRHLPPPPPAPVG